MLNAVRFKTLLMTGCITSVLMSGCASQATTTGAGAVEEKQVTIRLATAFDAARLESYNKVVEKWNSSHENIQVKLENTPFEEYWKKMQVMTASNTMPDVWNFVPGYGAQWIENEQLLALDDYVKNDPKLNKDDFQKGMIQYMTYGNKLYGFPYDVSALVMFYNKDLFDKAGVGYPTDNWTMDDVRNAAKKITDTVKSDQGKVYGLSTIMNPTWNSDSFYRAFGAELITKDGKTGVASQGGIKAITFFKENIELGITPKPEPGKSTQTLWLNGMSGMIFDGGWNIPTYKDTKFQWDMVKLPAGPSGQFSTGLGGTFVISKQTKYPKQAYEFLAYLTGTESLKELVTNTGAGVPGRRSAEEGLSPSMKKYAGLISTSVPYNAFNGSLELFDIQKKELEQVWYGVKKPEEALKTIETKGNEILQNKKK